MLLSSLSAVSSRYRNVCSEKISTSCPEPSETERPVQQRRGWQHRADGGDALRVGLLSVGLLLIESGQLDAAADPGTGIEPRT